MCDKSTKLRREFEAVVDFFLAERRDGWFPDAIQFERCARLAAFGHRWGITCHVGVEFGELQASVSVNAERARSLAPRKRGEVYELFDGIVRKMRALGYEGSWAIEPISRLPDAHFTRRLRNAAAIQREHRLLSGLDFEDVNPSRVRGMPSRRKR